MKKISVLLVFFFFIASSLVLTSVYAYTPILEQIAPNPTSYPANDPSGFYQMTYSASGNVTAFLQAVDLLIPSTGGSTSGCEASDFAGFPAGSIALIQRGTCAFAIKAANAQAAGASGVIIFNEGNSPDRIDAIRGTLGGPGITIPVVGTSFAIGQELSALPGVIVHMNIEAASVWAIDKSADQSELTLSIGEQLPVNYTVTVDIVFEGTVDNCVEVTDSLEGSLGTVCIQEAPKTFTYSRNIGPYDACGEYTANNIVSFVTNDTGNSGGDFWTVTVHSVCDAYHICDVNTGDCIVPICRTAGFWQTHAGTECPKKQPSCGSQNITQMVIDACGECIEVCGEIVQNTAFNDADSAVEAMCVPVKGDMRIQLARQLTAASLNCCLSGAGSDCAEIPAWQFIFNACNTACQNPTTTKDGYQLCIDALDCLNKGGDLVEIAPVICQPPLEDSCAFQALCNETLGLCFDGKQEKIVGSADACNKAIKSACGVIPIDESKGELACGSGTKEENLETCARVEVSKTGDTLGKIGDPVSYTITIQNTGSVTLYKDEITDTLLGDISLNGVDQANPYITTNTCGASLAAGASCTISLQRTVQVGDPDPLPNTVTVVYNRKADLSGPSVSGADDHEVNLFQPAVMIEKTGDTLSKVGDTVNCIFTITNISSSDSPDLTLASISDNVIGDLSSMATAAGCDVLTSGEVCTFQVNRTVAAGDQDPMINTVDVLYHPVGYPNDITASASHEVNLFQPSVSITKSGPALSKTGDTATYNVTINNTSSSDSPNLILDSIIDDVLGDLSDEAPAACDSIAPGASCVFDVQWTVAAVDVFPSDGQADDPVINTVTIHFHPDGFPNDITATASHELNLFQPSIAFSKTADTNLANVDETVNYTLTLNNTSSPDTPDLVCTITDGNLGVNKTVTLASGEGDVTNISYTVQVSDPDPLVNTADVSCSVTGFPNILSASSSWTVNVADGF